MSDLIRNSETLFQVEESNDYITIEGRAVVYNQVANIQNKYFEVILPTALDNCDLSDVSLLINHNSNSIPLARYRVNIEDSTMELFKKEDGLYFRAKLDPKAPTVQDLVSAMKHKNIDRMSFRFGLCLDGYNEVSDNGSIIPTRYIHSIYKISEISVVTWPAYSDTSAYLRSINDKGDEELLEDKLKKQKEEEDEHKLFIAKMLALY